MRVLVATTAGSGHFGPLLPFAGALREAGHEVVVAAPASFAPAVSRAGYPHRPLADAAPGELGAVFARLPSLSWEEANAQVIGEVFGRIDTRAALPGMEAAVKALRPDLILRESAEFSSYLTAERLGVPHAHVSVGLGLLNVFSRPVLEAPLTELGAEPGLPGLFSLATLTMAPASFEDPATAGGDEVRRFRDDTADGAEDPLPGWWPNAADPLVYMTFGTVAAGMGLFPDLYRGAVGALADLPIRVLLTVGDAGDPSALDPLPANVHVERWFPQRAVMPHASAMVGHGGFGTTMSGLANGVPMVVVPLFADQPHNARRVDAIGAGVALDGGPAAIGALAGAVARVLTDDSIRAGARRIADEIAGLPAAAEAVPLLEGLAR